MNKKHKEILIGAHTSTSGGLQNALFEGQQIGATTVQIFTSNQRQWRGRSLAQDAIDVWQKALDETGLKSIMSHASYLMNLGSPDPEVLAKSRQALREEIIRCLQLGIKYLNFHPGAALDSPVESCLNKIVESLKQVQDLFTGNEKLELLLETTAGQGSTVGRNFEELYYIIEGVNDSVPLGVCIDTCHIFVAGYDIRTKEDLENTLKKFDTVVGLKYLKAFHLNDSQKGLNSRVDRHEQIGDGTIGNECFKAIMQHPKLMSLPKYLETPGGPSFWEKEIALLKSYAEEVS